MFVLSIAVNCSFTIYFACYCVMIEGFTMLYVLGLLEAFFFCGLGWILTCTSVSISINLLSIFLMDLFHFQILHACMNLTTNEMFNYKRYPYLRDKRGRYNNRFSRGIVMNLFEFILMRPIDEEMFLDEQL